MPLKPAPGEIDKRSPRWLPPSLLMPLARQNERPAPSKPQRSGGRYPTATPTAVA